jgi:Tfp pilus assembly protein PilZ
LKKVLDLLEEFGQLNDAKIESGGNLAPTGELRWRELKEFYDRLMSISPAKKGLDRRRFLAYDIRDQVKHRGRLRVRADMDVFFRYQDSYLPSRVVNVSRGGLFMGSKILLTKGSEIKLYWPNLGSDYGDLFENDGEVAWTTPGATKSKLPRGMGVRFCKMKKAAQEQLDVFIVDALEEQLSSTGIAAPSLKKDGSANPAQ